ncbi:hypothetical protein AB9E13_34235, partial [Rhizobium leguminosarum]
SGKVVALDEGELSKLKAEAGKAYGLLKGLFADGKLPGAGRLLEGVRRIGRRAEVGDGAQREFSCRERRRKLFGAWQFAIGKQSLQQA